MQTNNKYSRSAATVQTQQMNINKNNDVKSWCLKTRKKQQAKNILNFRILQQKKKKKKTRKRFSSIWELVVLLTHKGVGVSIQPSTNKNIHRKELQNVRLLV